MSDCCDAAEGRRAPSWVHGAREILAWLIPSAMLVFVPKCPACLVAYVALWTGLGLSLTTASYLRWSMLLLCAASLVFLIAKRLRRMADVFSYVNQETTNATPNRKS